MRADWRDMHGATYDVTDTAHAQQQSAATKRLHAERPRAASDNRVSQATIAPQFWIHAKTSDHATTEQLFLLFSVGGSFSF